LLYGFKAKCVGGKIEGVVWEVGCTSRGKIEKRNVKGTDECGQFSAQTIENKKKLRKTKVYENVEKGLRAPI